MKKGVKVIAFWLISLTTFNKSCAKSFLKVIAFWLNLFERLKG